MLITTARWLFSYGESMENEKLRLDTLLKERNFFESREKAKNAIINGNIKISGKICNNPSKKFGVEEKLNIEIVGEPDKYVSRGAYKLEKAIKYFNIDISKKIATDIGSSTGGFSDVLLQNNIRKIYCIDVGKNQLHPKIRQSKKIVVYEQTDFRTIDGNLIKDSEIIVIDVSFISIEPIIKKIKEIFYDKPLCVVSLIKPQFECGIDIARKYKGIIKNKIVHKDVLRKVIRLWEENGFEVINLTFSPIKGGDGNVEYLLHTTLNKNLKSKSIDVFKVIEDGFRQK